MPAEPRQDAVEIRKAIWRVLGDGLPVVVTSHMRLDGDAVGSALALWHGLTAKGVRAYHLFQPAGQPEPPQGQDLLAPTPSMFGFLKGLECCLRDPAELPPSYNLVVIDCGGFDRLGELGPRLTGSVRTVNIDHHDSNACFGDLNYVDPMASSCGEMVYELLRDGGVPLTADIADCLFTAIVTDTGQFSYEHTTPEALSICAECMRAGTQPYELMRRLFMSPSPGQVKLRHLALGTLRFHGEGRIATMTVTEEMFRQTGLGPADTEGFAEIPIAIQGVQASALLKEMPGCDYIKVSMRSRESVDVCRVAQAFGGGGHVRAAGCEIRDGLENVRETVAGRLELALRSGPEG